VTELYAQGNHAVYAASGVVKGWRWNTANDERVCPICLERAGKVYPMDDTENLPPAHAGDRCWVTPEVMEPGEL
jgi:SPP1 gp7 family putative phage head morphogenesis protein